VALKSTQAAPVLLALCACGQAAHDDGLAPVPGDGVSGFGNSSAIELCRGSERVVPPSLGAAPAALCVPEAVEARACVADTDCDGIERCVCGRCIVRACQDAAACAEAEVCRAKRCTRACADDAACDPGERCVSGGCARACSSDTGCHAGELCDSLDEVCSAQLCSAAVPCGAGDRCEAVEAVGDVREPDLVQVGDERIAFIDIRRIDEGVEIGAIYRARVDAPNRWTADPAQPVLEADGEGGLLAPSALVDGDRVELFYELAGGARIERASSQDGGRTFVRQPEPVLEPAPSWEAGRVGSPAAFVLRGERFLAYEGGARAGVGVARLGATGAVRLAEQPVVSAATLEDPVFWRGVTEVGAPYALVVTDHAGEQLLRLYVTANAAEGLDAISAEGPIPADLNDSIGLVSSRDLVQFDRFVTGPVMARVTNLKAYLGEREPCVTLAPEGASITFVSTDASGQQHSGLARAGGPR
jgi:hypothetical protein